MIRSQLVLLGAALLCLQTARAQSACTVATLCPDANGNCPDLTVDAVRLASSVRLETRNFSSSSCAVAEGCVLRSGKRKLLRFDVATPNIGLADLVVGAPPPDGQSNECFIWSPCHQHHHFLGYALYQLLDSTGTEIVRGRKQAFCIADTINYSSNQPAKYNCDNQGLTAGWADLYGSGLECQWLDVTNVRHGTYILRVTVNPDGILPEGRYDNNVAEVSVRIK